MERKPDITKWAKQATELKVGIGESLEKILEDSSKKEERLKNSGLPLGISYGPFENFEEIEKNIPENKKDSKTLYFARCVPKDYKNNKNLEIERIKNKTLEQIKEELKKVPQGQDNYTIQLFEIWPPDYSGGFVINNGRVIVDIEEGDKYFTEENISKKQIGATLSVLSNETSDTGIHFNYSEDITEDEKKIMIEAVKYLNPNLKRELFEKLKVYADFFYDKEHGFKFIDYFEGEKVDKYTAFKKDRDILI